MIVAEAGLRGQRQSREKQKDVIIRTGHDENLNWGKTVRMKSSRFENYGGGRTGKIRGLGKEDAEHDPRSLLRRLSGGWGPR